MMKKYFLPVLTVIVLAVACKNDSGETAGENTTSDPALTVDGQSAEAAADMSGDAPAGQPDMQADELRPLDAQTPVAEDQEKWADDSGKPSTWAAAGFDDPMKFKKGFEKFRLELVAGDQKEKIAALMKYPQKRVKSKEQFLAEYSIIFNPTMKAIILSTDVNKIFRNQLGAMIGGGKMWFGPANNEYGFQIITVQ